MAKRKGKASIQGVVNIMMQKEEHSMLGHGFIEHLANLHHPKIMHHNCRWWEAFIVDMNGHNIA
jgi:hypothetical protein